MSHKKNESAKRSFQASVQATPSIASAYKPGIQALLPADKKRLASVGNATGSVALDEALKNHCPNAHRWDYGIGLLALGKLERVLWLEVHHAASGETNRVLKKLQWLKEWLRNEAPALNKLPATFIWLLSNVENPNDRRKRQQLAERYGLRRHQGVLNLTALDG